VFGTAGEHEVELRVVDRRGGEGRHAETVTVAEQAGRLALAAVRPSTPDDDEAGAFVAFENAGDATLDLGGWTIHDAAVAPGAVAAGPQAFAFPEGFELEPGSTVAVHTALGDDEVRPATDHALEWHATAQVLTEHSGRIGVADDDGNPVLTVRYEQAASGEYEIAAVEATDLEDWYGPVDVGSPIRLPLVGATLDRRIGRRAVQNGLEFVASALFLRGSGPFVRTWGLVATFLGVTLLTWLLSVGTGLLRPSIDPSGMVLGLLGALGLVGVGGVVWTTGAVRRRLGNRRA
jgi:hypothetical protein